MHVCMLLFLAGAGRVRERRTAALTPAEMQSRIQAREHLRHDIQRLWKGLLDAQKGDVDIVLDVLAGCNSLDERQQCMAGIMKAQPQVSYITCLQCLDSTLESECC